MSWSHIDEWREGDSENINEGLYSQPWTANFVASWKPNVDWNIAIRYRYGSGNRYYDPVDSIFIATEHQYRPIYSDFSNARLPDYQN